LVKHEEGRVPQLGCQGLQRVLVQPNLTFSNPVKKEGVINVPVFFNRFSGDTVAGVIFKQ
jgi:hypothetical protein